MFSIRLVCIGDSFTEGMCDQLRADGNYLGWADRLALLLADEQDTPVQYANLAVRGKLLDQVVTDQIDAALALDPTIVTFHAGPNDVLRRGTDLDDLFNRYDQAVQRLAATKSATVVLFTAIGRAGGTGKVAQLLADRFAKFNANVRATAQKYGCVVVDLEPIDVLTDRRLWFEDRLHLNAQGHARVAAAAFHELSAPSDNKETAEQTVEMHWWTRPLPVAPKSSRATDFKTDALWVKNHMLPWVVRRIKGVSSGDGRQPKDPSLREIH